MNDQTTTLEEVEAAARLPYPRYRATLGALEILGGTVLAVAVLAALDPVLGGTAGLAWLTGVLGTLVLTGYIAVRIIDTRRRRALLDFASEAQLLLNWQRPAWVRVEVRRWQSHLEVAQVRFHRVPGSPMREVLTSEVAKLSAAHLKPARIRIYYVPGSPMGALLIGKITKLAAARLGDGWALHRHGEADCWIEITRTEAAADEAEKPNEIRRAEEVTKHIFGERAAVKTESDEKGLATVEISFNMDHRLTSERVTESIERMVSAVLPNRWKADWNLEADKVTFRRRPDFPKAVPHPAIAPREGTARETYHDFRVRYGVDEDGNVMSWLPRRNPHHIVTGGTGKGKTVFMLGLLYELAHAGWQIFVCDAKLIEYIGLREWPNVVIVSSSHEEQTRLLHFMHETQQKRYKMITEGRASVDEFEPMAFFLDEFADYREELNDWYSEIKIKGDPSRPPVLNRYKSVVRKGRTARIHIVQGLQRPDVEYMSGEARDNFSQRTSLGRLSPDGAKMMWQSYHVGTTIPSSAVGRGTTTNDDGDPVEFQSYWSPAPDKVKEGTSDWAIVESLRPEQTDHPRIVIEDPEEETFGEGEKEQCLLTYTSIATARIREYSKERDGRRFAPPKPAQTIVLEPAKVEAPTAHEDETFEGYKDSVTLRLSELAEGMLLLVDESELTWGAVERIEDSQVVPGEMQVDYREFTTGDPGALSLDPTSTVTARPIK